MKSFQTTAEPVFLVIAEPNSAFSDMVVEFLQDNSLNVESIKLDQQFFLNYQTLAKERKNVYKIILIYGFQTVVSGVFLKIIDFLHLQNQTCKLEIPLVLISTCSTSLEILDEFDFGYQKFLSQQLDFLTLFLTQFKKSLIFLAQDLLIENKSIDYPLLLFFTPIQQGYIFNPQNKFYFQDEKSFFNLIKEYLLKPHQTNKFIVRGKVALSEKITQKIIYLHEQYFQKKLLSLQSITNEKSPALFREFSLVSNSQSQINKLLDQKIRLLIDLKNSKLLPSPSEAELNKALVVSRNQKNLHKKQNKAKNRLQKKSSPSTLKVVNQAHNLTPEAPSTKNFSTEFVGKIEQLFSSSRHRERLARQEKNITQGSQIIKKTQKRRALFYLGAFVFGGSFLILSLFGLFQLSQATLQNQLYQVVKNNPEKIKRIDKSINSWFFSWQLSQYEKIFPMENLSTALDLRAMSQALSGVFFGQEKIKQITFDLYNKTLEGGVDLNSFYEQLLLAIDEQIKYQKDFNAYLLTLNFDLYQEADRVVWTKSLEKNKLALKNTLQIKIFLQAFKDLILRVGKSNLLILVQDSNELRPSGGFLTEAIILGFNNANLVDKQVFSISDLDERVYGHKVAGQDIKDLLGEENLFLHDSNWQADFAKSGQEMQWFIEQATGSKIDLVIAINSKTIKEILAVLGDLQLNNGFTVNSNDFLLKQQEFVTNDYGNDFQETFTWQTSNVLLEKLLKLTDVQLFTLGEVLLSQLNQRELLLYSNQQALQQAIETNSWSGKKTDLLCPAEFEQNNCFLDFLFQVETNVGVNKVNAQIKETIEHSLGISEKFIRHKRKIIFENSAGNEIWPLGSYRNYLRLYLHAQANLEKIELNGQVVNLNQVKIIDTEQGKELSMLVEIPKQSKVELVLTYLVPNQMKTPFSYVFLDQKQAGIFDKKTNYKIVFDEQFKPQLIAPQATYQDKTVYFNRENTDHFLFAISFDQ